MEALLPALLLLACPIGMGLMMFFMARGQRSSRSDSSPAGRRADAAAEPPESLELLREEHRRLGEEIERLQAPAGRHEPADR
jgi:hypothetical protein